MSWRYAFAGERRRHVQLTELRRSRLTLTPRDPRIYFCAKYIDEARMRVAKWGNSLAIRLPASVVEALALKEGDEIEVFLAAERELAVARKPTRAGLLARLRAFRGRLPADFKFDRDEANAR